jgi:hypothetical protein
VPASTTLPVDDTSLLSKLNLEIVGELGKGGFGTCKYAAQKRFVAVKLVNDPEIAKASIREGQRLLRAKHKNIRLMRRVHDLNPMLGKGSCALEMQVVTGRVVFDHPGSCPLSRGCVEPDVGG